jgi:hypothetical protein
MKSLLASVGVALLLVTACSHKSEVTETPTAATTQDQNYASQAQQEINTLQNRLDNLRNATHARKFHGNRAQLRNVVNAQYAKLGEAKRELQDLQTAAQNDYAAKKARLEATLSGIRGALDSVAAE